MSISCKGEFEKAITIYDELAKEDSKVERIRKNYFAFVLKLADYKQAEKYFKKLLRVLYPSENRNPLDKALEKPH